MQHPRLKKERARRLSRRARTLLAVGALALLAVGVAVLVPRFIAANPGASAPMPTADLPYRTLATAERAGLTSITVSQTDGDEYTLVYESERLYLLDEAGGKQAVNEAIGESMLAAVSSLSVEDVVAGDAAEVAGALVDMGLQPPRITVTVRRTDGDLWLQLGTLSPDTTYHYYRWSGDAGIYLCDAGTYEAFEYGRQMLLPVEQPAFTAALVDKVTLQKRSDETPIVLSFAVTSSDTATGALCSPYAYPLRADSAESLLSAVTGLRLGARVEAVTDANRAALGVDDPLVTLTVHQAAGYETGIDASGQLTLVAVPERIARFAVLGAEGAYFYRVEYEGVVYQVSRLLLQAFAEADPAALCTRAPADLDGAALAAVSVQAGEKALKLRVTRTERVQANNELETDATGAVIYDTAVTANGEPLALEAYEAFAERLDELTVSGVMGEPPALAGQTPRWRLTLTAEDGRERTLEAYPRDAFSDALAVDGVALHYLNNEALDTLLGPLRELLR